MDGAVHGHYSKNFASEVSLLDRWGSREALVSLDTEGVPSRYAELVRGAYAKVSGTIGAAAKQRG